MNLNSFGVEQGNRVVNYVFFSEKNNEHMIYLGKYNTLGKQSILKYFQSDQDLSVHPVFGVR